MKVQYITDIFNDFQNNEHHFVIVALSESDTSISAKYEVKKWVRLGVAICSPEDTFNLETGINLATSRALKAPITIASTSTGQINTKLVDVILQNEAQFLKTNPNDYIKGYNDAKKRYEKNVHMQQIKESLTLLDSMIINKCIKDPDRINTLLDYAEWAYFKN